MENVYTSFDLFMKKSVEKAEKIDDFEMENTFTIIIKLITNGWVVYTPVCRILGFGIIAFGAALTALMASPIGWIIAAVLGVSAIALIKTLYENKVLPLVVHRVGEGIRPLYERLKNEGDQEAIDRLVLQCANLIVEEMRKRIRAS